MIEAPQESGQSLLKQVAICQCGQHIIVGKLLDLAFCDLAIRNVFMSGDPSTSCDWLVNDRNISPITQLINQLMRLVRGNVGNTLLKIGFAADGGIAMRNTALQDRS